ncbi:MAG: hypothetical protein ACFFE8_02830 [Candidatus Heimdallarchaeota archaeon]
MEELLHWLLTTGGPVIRYRTFTELNPENQDYNAAELISSVKTSQKVALWLSLHPSSSSGSPFGIHGSKRYFYENFAPKVIQYGLNASMDMLSQYLAFFSSKINLSKDWGILNLVKTCYAAFTIQLGVNDDASLSYLVRRLNQIYTFVKDGIYDIYVEPSNYPSIPKPLRNRPLLNPDHYIDNLIPIPTIYDVLAAKTLYNTNYVDSNKINTIINYIFTDQFDSLHPEYGLYYDSIRKRFYVHGWKPHLENYSFRKTPITNASLLLLQLYIYSHFPAVQSQDWFIWGMEILESYRTDRGTFILPKGFLRENFSGYWVNGSYMGLGENRRSKNWRELESTYWILTIKKNLKMRS